MTDLHLTSGISFRSAYIKHFFKKKEEGAFHEYEKRHSIPDTDSEDSKAIRTVKERLIITYSGNRTKKDADNKKRGVARLKKHLNQESSRRKVSTEEGTTNFLRLPRT